MSLLPILLTTAVSLIKFGQGLDIDFRHLIMHVNRWLVFRGVLAVVFLVPLLFLILILIFQPTIAITLAIICIGVAPAADLSTRQVKLFGGNGHLAESILLISALISIMTAPLLLKFYDIVLRLHLEVQFTQVIKQVAVAQFFPIILSIILRKIFSKLISIAKYITICATLLLIICFVMIIIQKHTAFTEFRIQAYIAIIVVSIGAFALGVLFAGKDFKNQISLAIESSARNLGLAFLIAGENFSTERANLAMIPFLVTTIVTITACTILLKNFQKNFGNWFNIFH